MDFFPLKKIRLFSFKKNRLFSLKKIDFFLKNAIFFLKKHMTFFQVLFDKTDYLDKDFLLSEEHSKDLFLQNLSSLLSEKEFFSIKTSEIVKKYRTKNYRLNFLSDAEIFSYIKTFQSSQVKNSKNPFFLKKTFFFFFFFIKNLTFS